MHGTPRHPMTWVLAAAMLGLCSPALGQSLSDRIADYHKRTQRKQEAKASRATAQRRTLSRRMGKLLGPVDLDGVPAREAFAWWAETTGVQLVINWKAFANEGIDPDTPINVNLKVASAATVLRLMMEQTAQDGQPLIFEVKPWFIRIMTRRAALRHPVTRVYYIGDLLVRVPNFSGAPGVGQSSSDGTSSNSNNSGSSNSDNDNDNDQNQDDDDDGEESLSTTERADQIAQLIRDTIEPDIWIANGGEFASITYLQRKLVVRAPEFVQRQIGDATGESPGRGRASVARGGVVRTTLARPGLRRAPTRSKSTGVSGVQAGEPTSVSGVQQEKK